MIQDKEALPGGEALKPLKAEAGFPDVDQGMGLEAFTNL